MTHDAPPATRRKFHNEWDEIKYLYHKILYWLYSREDNIQASGFASRLERLLRKADPRHEVIFGEECRSLVWELKGNLTKAIYHRERELELIEKLHQLAADVDQELRDFMLQRYDVDDWSDALDLLAILHHDNGDLDRALQTLEESKQLCKKHGIEFDGQDLVDDYLDEKHSLNGARR